MNPTTTRRIRQAVTAPALIGAIACSGFLPDAAAAVGVARLARHCRPPTPAQPVRIVPGLVVRPEPDVNVLPLQGYRLTATFGNAGGLWSSDHTGLDFAAPEGTPLVAIGAGVVTEVGYDGAYGNKTVDHARGRHRALVLPPVEPERRRRRPGGRR